MKNKTALFLLLISFLFILTSCQQSRNDEIVPGSIDNKLEIKRLSDELIRLFYDGSDEHKVLDIAKKINNISELVIEGKVISLYSDGQEASKSDLYSGYMIVEVKSIKKGSYPYKKIKFLFGMASSYWQIPLYPGYIKTKYHTGDMVRVYLHYVDDLGTYTAVAGFYGIKPIVNFNIF